MTEPTEVDRGRSDASGRRWLPATLVVGLLAVAVGAVAFAMTQRADAADRRDQDERRRDAVLVATGFVEALISYDFEDLDAQQRAVEGFVTDDFRDDFADAFSDEVRDQIVAEKARSTATVENAWITVDAEDEAGVVVHAVSDIDSEAGATAEIESYLRVHLVGLDGGWRVDDLTSLGSRDRSAPGDDADG